MIGLLNISQFPQVFTEKQITRLTLAIRAFPCSTISIVNLVSFSLKLSVIECHFLAQGVRGGGRGVLSENDEFNLRRGSLWENDEFSKGGLCENGEFS